MKKDSYYDDKGERFMALMSFIYDNHVNATVRHEQDGLKVRCTFKFWLNRAFGSNCDEPQSCHDHMVINFVITLT